LAGHDFIGFACSLDAFHLLFAPVLSADFHLLFALEKRGGQKLEHLYAFQFVCQDSEITP
jgi:hypothetical protein